MLADDPDVAGGLGDRDEFAGTDHTQLRVAPAGQRLVADGLAGGEVDDRLEVDEDLAALDGTRERAAHARATRRLARDPRDEHGDVVLLGTRPLQRGER